MGHRLFPLLSIQVSPVPMKGVPELAGPVLKSLQTLGLAVVGSGRSQPQHGEFANPPASHCGSSQNPVDGRDVPSDLRSLLRCTIRKRDRLPSSPPSPAVAQSSGICRFSITSSPNHRKRRWARCYHLVKSARPFRIKPSVGRCPNRDNQNHRRNLQRGFSTRLFVGITASGSTFNVNRLAIYTDTRPLWERGAGPI